MATDAIEKWWWRCFEKASLRPGVGLWLTEFYRKLSSPGRRKASLAAGRKGGGMNAALLKRLPMKLDSLILRRALRKGAQSGIFKASHLESLPEEERVILFTLTQAPPAGM